MSYQAAHQWACRLYAMRVCGMSPPETNRYLGEFDCEAVVNSAPVPSQSDVMTHQTCWEEFHAMFRRAWGDKR